MFEPNQHQRIVVEHRGGPLLVLAGAGSGKTGTLACRLAHLISTGSDPTRVCLVTFTRRAAVEMLSRAGRMLREEGGGSVTARIWGGTFHALANRVLRMHGSRIGLDPSFGVIDQSDASELMGLIRSEVLGGERTSDPPASKRRFPRSETLVGVYSRMVNTQEPLQTVLDRDFPWCSEEYQDIRSIFASYSAAKHRQRLLDFDDLLLYWRALGALGEGSQLVAGMWDEVLVDEYQDTNALQGDVLASLRPEGCGLVVVGDDAQAIYAFRAASSANILDFPQRFPGASIVCLERNYRSTTPILSLANAIMAEAPPGSGYRKELWSQLPGRRRPLLRHCEDEAAQAQAVCDSVLAHREAGVALRQQAVLFRAGHHADLLELALAERNIPYVKYGGLKFLESGHVKDLICLLRVLDNPWDELAWFRALQLPEGIGPARARRIMAELGMPADAPSADPAATPLARLLAAPPVAPESARSDLAAMRGALEDCQRLALGPAQDVERLSGFLESVVERRYQRPAPRIADLAQLGVAAARYATRAQFVSELTLDPPVSTGDLAADPTLDEDWLVLSTVHSAKGGEWDVVHVLHASDGMFPSDMATRDRQGIEEERRLLYVAVTRARVVLEINYPLRYYPHPGSGRRGDAHSYAQISRFLTPAVQSLMDKDHASAILADPGGQPPEEGSGDARGAAEVDAFLAALLG